MATETYLATKHFTVRQANAALPLVRAITKDIVNLSREILERRERLHSLLGGRRLSAGNPYDEELAQVEEDLEKDESRLQSFLGELTDLGVEPRDSSEGLVDFPARLNGRPVFLCWKLGEDSVQFWHEVDAGFAGRKPIGVATPRAAGERKR